ncbi:hypothetical protein D3C86_1219570 [compost metagenome]
MCGIGDVYRGAFPSGLLLESETIISHKIDIIVNQNELSDDEFLVYEALQQQSSLKVQEIISILNKKNILPVLQKLMEKDIIVLEEEIKENYKPKLVRYVKLHSKYESDNGLSELLEVLKSANKQKEIVLAYFQISASEKKPITVKKLTEVSNATPTTVKALIEKEIFEEYYLQHDRVSFDGKASEKQLVLSDARKLLFQKLKIVS